MAVRSQDWQRAIVTMAGALVFALTVCALYWARTIFIPVALAIFLVFVLTPVVRLLEKLKLGRLPSVFVVLAIAAALIVGAGMAIFRQGREMALELPTYTENIKTKTEDLVHMVEGSSLSARLREMIDTVSSSWKVEPETSTVPGEPEAQRGDVTKPMHVVIDPETNAWITRFSSYLDPVLETLVQALLAAVLVVFMLCKREDLRNRFLWLVGHGHLTMTTRAVDDVVQRLSRYLFAQFMINLSYGMVLSFGLWVIGVHHAFLWGALGGALRYVPYVGAPFAALFPIALSVLQFPGWFQPLAVIGLILVLELVTANVIEPIFFGHSMGVSEVTLLVSAALWTYLWGPVGLVLAMPITVCLVVVGEYVPGLEFIAVLLGDRPALKPQLSLYQRLAARDQDEAARIAETFVKENSSEALYDKLLIPVLRQARQDASREIIGERDLEFMLQATREICEEAASEEDKAESADHKKEPVESDMGERVLILGLSARDEFDHAVLEMLGHVLDAKKWNLELAPSTLLASEAIPYVEAHNPAIICISCLRPGGLAHTRYLCKRLHVRFPDVHILVGCWGLDPDEKQDLDALLAAGADRVKNSLLAVRDHLHTWRPVLAAEQEADQEHRPSGALQSV